jgi:hypothetical protein
MSRCKDAPIGFECPSRHNCPHLEQMSTTWVMEQYQEAFELQLAHRKKFKAKVKHPPIRVKVRRRGVPLGHPGWHRREPDHIDQVVHVSAPATCPHCQNGSLQPCAELHEHVQEDIVLMPRMSPR